MSDKYLRRFRIPESDYECAICEGCVDYFYYLGDERVYLCEKCAKMKHANKLENMLTLERLKEKIEELENADTNSGYEDPEGEEHDLDDGDSDYDDRMEERRQMGFSGF